jgi:hypothetical protein
MNKLIKNFIDSHSSVVYSFNWHLYLDEVMAERMTQEVFALFLQSQRADVGELKETDGATQLRIQLKLFHRSYDLYLSSLKSQGAQELNRWAQLRPIERSALFLKHKCSLSYKDMQGIYSVPASSIIGSIHQAREFMLEGREDLF